MVSARTQLEIEVLARDLASKALRDINREAGLLGSAMGEVTKIAAGFTVGSMIQRLPGLLVESANAAAEDAASQAQLQQALENTGASWAEYGAALEGVAEDSERLGFADEKARQSLSLLLAQTGSAGEAQRRFAIATDLSRGANIELSTAARLVGRITEENVNVLSRYGVQIREGASETEALAAITARFGGQAEAYGDSAAGSFARFNTAIGNAKESLGTGLLPLLTLGAELAAEVLDFWNRMYTQPVFKGAGFLKETANALGDLTGFSANAKGEIQGLEDAEKLLSQTTGLLHDEIAKAVEKMREEEAAAAGLNREGIALVGTITALGIATGLLNDTQEAALGRSEAWAIWLQNLRAEADALGQSLDQLSAAQGINTSFGAFTGLAPSAAPSVGSNVTNNTNQQRSLVNYGTIMVGAGNGGQQDIDMLLRGP